MNNITNNCRVNGRGGGFSSAFILVGRSERELPKEQDIGRLLKAKCYWSMDTPKFRLMVVLLIDTGLKIWEACSIRRQNINFERLEIRVMGKGNKERVVPISPLTAALLNTWIERCEDSEWLFPAKNLQGYWRERSFERTIKRVCHRHGIKPITPHALRQFFATHNLKNGARLEVVSRILGHASTSITADIYVHVDREDIHSTHKQFSPFAKFTLEAGSDMPSCLSTNQVPMLLGPEGL